MRRSRGTPAEGRVRLAAIVGRILGLALLMGVAGHVAPAWAQDELFVTNQDSNSVTVYVRTANGDVTPLRILSGGSTGLNDPSGLFLDTVNKELFVANAGNDTVTVYPLTWPVSDTPPVRTLSGGLTGLNTPTGLFLDRVNDELFVANFGNDSITVYSRTANGDTAPLRTLIGANTGLGGPQDLDLDTVHGELFVANFLAGSVTVYPRTWPVLEPNTAFLRRLSGVVNTDLNGPFGLAVDTVHNELFVANFSTPSVTVYSRTASGDTGPTRTLSGGNTGLSSPQFVAVIVSAPIPTLSEWAQIGMVALLAIGGLLALRRRSGRGKRLHTTG